MTLNEVGASAIPVSVSTSIYSWCAETLPLMQWLAAGVAIVSGVVGVVWVAYKFYKARSN